MPTRRILTRVPRTFIPPEAKTIADELRRIAAETRAMTAGLGLGGKPMDALLQELSGMERFRGFAPVAQDAGALADWLEAQARRLENTKVTTWEEVWEEVWVPDEPDAEP